MREAKASISAIIWHWKIVYLELLLWLRMLILTGTYSRYGIGFDWRGSFSFPGIRLGRIVIIFGVDISLSTKIDNR